MQFHVNDLMSSHVNPRVNDEFLEWLNKTYGALGEVTATRGKVHDYLGMIFEFGNGEVKVNMIDYVKGMLKEFPIKMKREDKAVKKAIKKF